MYSFDLISSLLFLVFIFVSIQLLNKSELDKKKCAEYLFLCRMCMDLFRVQRLYPESE